MNILDFLMWNDVDLVCNGTGLHMTADEMYELGGEFIVWKPNAGQEDVYRGTDFSKAMEALTGVEYHG